MSYVCYIQIRRILSQWKTKTLSTKRLKRLALYSFKWLYHSLAIKLKLNYSTACAMFVKTLRTDRKLELRKRGYIYHLIHLLFLVDFAGVLNTVGYRVKNCTGMELFYVWIFFLAVHSYACCVYRFFERYHYDTHTEDYLRGSQLQR